MSATEKPTRLERYLAHPAMIIIVVLASFFLGLGTMPLVDLDEGAFSSATMEMLARGDYITTYLGGELRFDKPILIYWLQAASVSVFGLTEFALRLPSAVMASLWALSVYLFSRKLLDRQAAWVACSTMVASICVIVVGRAAIADALLNLWLCLTMFCGYLFWTTGDKAYSRWGYAFIGLGLLTKGPIAIMIPGAVTVLYALLRFQWRPLVALYWQPLGWLITLAIALPWYVLEYLDQGWLFIEGFILKHNVSRFTDTMEQHGGAAFYYIGLLPLLLLPNTGLLLRTLNKLPKIFTDPLDSWLWTWFLFVLVFFSFSNTKLPHYILYGATPLFILMGKYHALLRSHTLALLPIVLWLLVLLALPHATSWLGDQEKDAHTRDILLNAMQYYHWSYTVSVIGVLGITLWLWLIKPCSSIASLLIVAFMHTLLLTVVVLPFLITAKQDAIKQAGLIARDRHESAVMHGISTPTFGVYRQKVTPKRAPKAGELLLTKAENLENYPNAKLLYAQSGIILLKVSRDAK